MVNQPQFDVFLAHHSPDKHQVIAIANKLKRRGLNLWLDEEQVPPGRSFQDVIQEAIPQVKSAVIFIGPLGLGAWQAVELRALITRCVKKGIPVIPVLLPGVNDFPEKLLFLSEYRSVSFSKQIDEVEALDNLEWGITGKRPQPQRHLTYTDEAVAQFERQHPNPPWPLPRPSNSSLLVALFIGAVIGTIATAFISRTIDNSPSNTLARFSDVKNVPEGVFKYAGSTILAAIDCKGKGINYKIQSDHKHFQLKYVNPKNVYPGSDDIEPNSGQGIQLLIDGYVSFAISSRPLDLNEKDLAKTQGLNLEEIPVARDVLTFVVNFSLPSEVRGLTLQDLVKIYTSKVKNWKDIQAKGPNLAIIPYVHEAERTSVYSFQTEVLKGVSFGSTVLDVPDTTRGLRTVGTVRGAIYRAPASLIYGQNEVKVKPFPIGKNLEDLTLPFNEDFNPDNECGNVNSKDTSSPPLKPGYPTELQQEKIYVIVKRDGSTREKAGLAYANLLKTDEGQRLMRQIGLQPIH